MILLITYNFKFFNKNYLIYFIFLFCILDYIRISKEIINPQYHSPHKQVLKHNTYLDKYFEEDQIIKYLLKDNEKHRIFDNSGNDINRWSSFNIESIHGYHPAKISLYDELLQKINTKGYFSKGLLKALNVKYIIHNQKGEIQNFTYIDEFDMNYFD